MIERRKVDNFVPFEENPKPMNSEIDWEMRLKVVRDANKTDTWFCIGEFTEAFARKAVWELKQKFDSFCFRSAFVPLDENRNCRIYASLNPPGYVSKKGKRKAVPVVTEIMPGCEIVKGDA